MNKSTIAVAALLATLSTASVVAYADDSMANPPASQDSSTVNPDSTTPDNSSNQGGTDLNQGSSESNQGSDE